MDDRLNKLRHEIDLADSELIGAFVRRMRIAGGIAEVKREIGKAVFDSSREAAKLEAVAEISGTEMAGYTRALYSLLFELSKDYQQRILGGLGFLADKLNNENIRVFPELEAVSVACQGRIGAYSETAAMSLFKQPEIHFFPTFEAVMQAVADGRVRYGVLPIENSSAGGVEAVYSLLNKYGVYIARSVKCPVQHSLLALDGVEIREIREIISHEQAINQCSDFIAAHPEIKVSCAVNTAMAAELVSKSGRRDIASLSSRRCAEIYGLRELEVGVQNDKNNCTRFLCVSRELEIYPDADRTSVVLVTDNKPGALYKVLSRFFALGINITRLVSQPIAGSDFESRFYLDFESPALSDDFAALMLIGEGNAVCREFKYLGSYREKV